MGLLDGLLGSGPNTNQQAAQINTSGATAWQGSPALSGANQNAQQNAQGLALAQANGTGPSAAEKMLQAQTAAAQNNANALASSGSGAVGQGAARRNAMLAGMGAASQLGGQAAAARAGEQIAGISAYGGLAGQARGQDLEAGNMNAQLASQQAQIQSGQNIANQNASLQQEGMDAKALGAITSGVAGGLGGLMGAMADADLKEPGHTGKEAHISLREEPSADGDPFLLIYDHQTGEGRKLATEPLDPVEQKIAFERPHGAGEFGDPNRQRTEVGDGVIGNQSWDKNAMGLARASRGPQPSRSWQSTMPHGVRTAEGKPFGQAPSSATLDAAYKPMPDTEFADMTRHTTDFQNGPFKTAQYRPGLYAAEPSTQTSFPASRSQQAAYESSLSPEPKGVGGYTNDPNDRLGPAKNSEGDWGNVDEDVFHDTPDDGLGESKPTSSSEPGPDRNSHLGYARGWDKNASDRAPGEEEPSPPDTKPLPKSGFVQGLSDMLKGFAGGVGGYNAPQTQSQNPSGADIDLTKKHKSPDVIYGTGGGRFVRGPKGDYVPAPPAPREPESMEINGAPYDPYAVPGQQANPTHQPLGHSDHRPPDVMYGNEGGRFVRQPDGNYAPAPPVQEPQKPQSDDRRPPDVMYDAQGSRFVRGADGSYAPAPPVPDQGADAAAREAPPAPPGPPKPPARPPTPPRPPPPAQQAAQKAAMATQAITGALDQNVANQVAQKAAQQAVSQQIQAVPNAAAAATMGTQPSNTIRANDMDLKKTNVNGDAVNPENMPYRGADSGVSAITSDKMKKTDVKKLGEDTNHGGPRDTDANASRSTSDTGDRGGAEQREAKRGDSTSGKRDGNTQHSPSKRDESSYGAQPKAQAKHGDYYGAKNPSLNNGVQNGNAWYEPLFKGDPKVSEGHDPWGHPGATEDRIHAADMDMGGGGTGPTYGADVDLVGTAPPSHPSLGHPRYGDMPIGGYAALHHPDLGHARGADIDIDLGPRRMNAPAFPEGLVPAHKWFEPEVTSHAVREPLEFARTRIVPTVDDDNSSVAEVEEHFRPPPPSLREQSEMALRQLPAMKAQALRNASPPSPSRGEVDSSLAELAKMRGSAVGAMNTGKNYDDALARGEDSAPAQSGLSAAKKDEPRAGLSFLNKKRYGNGS